MRQRADWWRALWAGFSACWLSIAVGCGGPTTEPPAPPAQTGDPAPQEEPAIEEPAVEEPAAPAGPVVRFDTDAPLTAEGVEVLWAAWGNRECTRAVEVTDIVREHAAAAGSITSNNPALVAAMGDPLPGEKEWLTVLLKTPAGSARVGMFDSILYLTIQPGLISPSGSGKAWTQAEADRANAMLVDGAETGVVWARWGNDGKGAGWSDAQTPIQAQFDADGTLFNRPTGMPDVRKPNNYRAKTLRLLLAIDGQPVGLHLRGGSYVALRPTEEMLAEPAAFDVGPGGFDAPYVTAHLEGVDDVITYLASADGSHLFVLAGDGSQLLKVDAATFEVVGEIEGLAPGYVAMALTPGGDRLYIGGPTNGFDRNRESSQLRGVLVAVEPESFRVLGSPVQVRCDIKTLAVMGDGNLIALNGSGDSMSFLGVIDPKSGVVLGQSSVRGVDDDYQLHPDGERLYIGHGKGLQCRWFDPALEPGQAHEGIEYAAGTVSCRGRFTFIDDTRYLIGHAGTLVRLSQNLQRHYLGVRALPENSGGAASRELGALFVCVQDGMRVLAWPSLEPAGEVMGRGVLADMRLGPDGRTAYARWMRGATIGGLRGPGGDTTAALVAIDLASLTPPGLVADGALPRPIAPEGDAIVARLPLGTDISGLVMPQDGGTLYALDAAEGRVLRIDPLTLEIGATSGPLPSSSNEIAVDATGRWVAVSAAPTLFRSNKDHESGTIVRLDPETLGQIGDPIVLQHDIREIALDTLGRLYASGGSNQSTSVFQLDAGSGAEIGARGSYQGASICVAPDASALYMSTRGLSPASLAGVRLDPRRPLDRESEQLAIEIQKDTQAGNKIWITTDGRYIAAMGGGVYRVPTGREPPNILGLGSLEQICGAAGAGRVLFACDHTNTLTAYELPSLKPTGQLLLDGTLTDMCYDPATKRLYGVLRPGGKFEGFERFAGEILGDIVAIDTTALGGG